ncbi:hypothetical protein D9756_002785 [Leucocoprinus leucothites]|uniref:DUF7137 domain-containing protein n=1 Tax=Leucocoprinus leucothites TaxID=201217 RepID=A0A8H5LLT3_9AGAR|nr:hypothetical protein D9756_002785 [Leucoagaricus leucothites]
MSQLPPSPAVTLGGTVTPVSAGAITAQPDTYALSNQASLAPTASNAISPGIATVTISGNDSAPQNHTGTSIPNNSPAGGIIMTKPPQSSTSFYKIAANEIVTFGWNFTFIAQNPDNITISAICDNGNTYPVGPTNGVIPGTATEVAWDLHSWQVNNPGMPLAQGTYTLTMWDNRGKSAVPMPGLMRPYNNLRFALYTPQPYIPLDGGESLYAGSSVLVLNPVIARMDLFRLSQFRHVICIYTSCLRRFRRLSLGHLHLWTESASLQRTLIATASPVTSIPWPTVVYLDPDKTLYRHS